MLSGTVSLLRPLVPLTSETGSGLLPTLTRRDYRHPNAKSYAERGGGKKGEQLPNALGGPVNADWAEWFMGYPAGHTSLPEYRARSGRRRGGSRA
jgi:hypothetical protein